MGVFDFLKRKKGSELRLEDIGGEERPALGEEEFKPAFGGERPEFGPSFPSKLEPSGPGISGTDVQLILTKLDLINQRLENMDRRLQVIEKVAKES